MPTEDSDQNRPLDPDQPDNTLGAADGNEVRDAAGTGPAGPGGERDLTAEGLGPASVDGHGLSDPAGASDPGASGEAPVAGGISEAEVRRLLAAAGETVRVDPGAPLSLTGLPEPGKRRILWPTLAAAAAVLVVVGLVLVVTRPGADNPGPRVLDPVAPGTVGPTGTGYVYPDNQMPSLLGYTADEARNLLTERGYRVEVRPQSEMCNVEDQVARSEPVPGTVLEPGQTVTVFAVKNRMVIDCVGEIDWQPLWELARFARGLGPLPELASEVELRIWTPQSSGSPMLADAQRTVQELADRDNWGVCAGAGCRSVLAGLAAILTDPGPWSGASPWVAAEYTGRCSPDGVLDPNRHEYSLWIEVPVDGQFCPSSSMVITLNDQGRISGVGYVAPYREVQPDQRDDVDPVRLDSAEEFVSWAREDGPAPHFADRVRILFGGAGAWDTAGWTDDPESRNGWGACSGLDGDDCGLSALYRLQHDLRGVVVTAGRAPCRDESPLPDDLAEAADADAVGLSVAEPRNCADDIGIEMWIDEDGAIYAVNLVLPGE